MGILCSLFGHKVKYLASEASGCWSRQFYNNKPVSDWYKTLRVPTECQRCGHRHADSFIVPDGWTDKPES